MTIEARKTFEEIKSMYSSDNAVNTFNCITYGLLGTGKTYSLRTARKPVLIYSFDPGGTKVLKEEIERGEVMVVLCENENAKAPTEFRKWEDMFMQHRRERLFEQVGTVVIDSLTFWADACMSEVMKTNVANRAKAIPGIPIMQDWMIQMRVMSDHLRLLTTLPCDTILNAHIDSERDEVTGKIFTSLMITGKLKRKVPLLFDELYVSMSVPSSTGSSYVWLTQNDGIYEAKTRLGVKNTFEKYEPQDYKALLKKAGYDTEDKPLLT